MHVIFMSAVDFYATYDCRISRMHIARSDRLQRGHNVGSRQDRINSLLRHPSVAPLSNYMNVEIVDCCHAFTAMYSNCTDRHAWPVMKAPDFGHAEQHRSVTLMSA